MLLAFLTHFCDSQCLLDRDCRSSILQSASLKLLGERVLAKKGLCLVHLDYEEYNLEIGDSGLIKYFYLMGFCVAGSVTPSLRSK